MLTLCYVKKCEYRFDLKLQLKPLTDLLNILIQLLIRIDLSHQVLQLLLTQHLEREQMYPFIQLQKSTGVQMLCALYSSPMMALNAKIECSKSLKVKTRK